VSELAGLEKLGIDVRLDPVSLKDYGQDWTRFATPQAKAVLFPRSVDEVAKALRFCRDNRIAVVPSGGRTGLAGGAVAAGGEAVLSLSKLDRLDAPDLVALTVRAQAGVVHEKLQESLKNHGLHWPVDLASKGSCHIGGNLATNAGGLRVIRYGHARHWVQSVQAVTIDGDVIEANGDLEKNNTGYDLRHLLVGSEGTLAVITAATLSLAPLSRSSRVALFAVSGFPAVLEILRDARSRRLPMLAFECWSRACLEAVRDEMKFPDPFEAASPLYALVEIEEGEADLDAWLGEVLEKGLVVDGTMAGDPEGIRRLWRYRENITESLSHRGLVYKNDLALPLRELPAFTAALERDSAALYPKCSVFIFGHIGDGNLHVNVLDAGGRSAAEFRALCEKSNHPLFGLVRKHGGSIAAEHGIGLLKKDFLEYSRPPAEIALLKGIKRAFDPLNLLNPGKIFDL
jgi:FAD/FMN-containing dehydrogenase